MAQILSKQLAVSSGLGVVDVEGVARPLEGVPHGPNVGLYRAGGHGPNRQIDAVHAALDAGHVAGHGHGGGVVGVHPQEGIRPEELAETLGRLVAGPGIESKWTPCLRKRLMTLT